MPTILALLVCTLLYLWLIKIGRKKHPPLPPGPPTDPLLGHLRLISTEDQGNLFHKLKKQYGDVIHLHFLGRSVIVLNSVEAAVDLLEKRSNNYSDRPRFVMFELMGWVRTLTFMSYGKIFQRHRRMLQRHLNMKQSATYHPLQTNAAHCLLQNLMSTNKGHDDHLHRFATDVIMRVAYGHQITHSDDDPYVGITQRTSHVVGASGSPGSTPVDFFPFLQYLPSWFPGAYYANFARENRNIIDTLHDYPFEQVQEALATGKGKASFLSYYLENQGHSDVDTLDIKGAAGVMYCAGAESTWSTMSVFLIAMVLHPECQARAQKEIDSIVGSGRLPEFSDRSSLPYVEGILQETLRWHPVVPTGIPHRSLEDDIYRGMFIPKGSLVIANTRSMTLDEHVYANASEFNPARYLPKPDGNNEPHPVGPFGFGRRICPGRHLADAGLWISFASILATLDVLKPIGENGEEITPEFSLSFGIVSQPRPYQCRIRPRNEAARSLILATDITWDN